METLYSCAKKNNADIVTADYFESSESVSTEISLLRKDLRESTETLKRKILKNGCRLWSSIFRRNLFFDNNLFFPEGLFYEDNAIGAALFLSASKIIKLDRCIYHYRIDNYSTTRSINNYRLFDRLKTSIMMLDSAKRIDSNSSFTSEIEDLFVRLYYINSIRGCIYGFTTTQSKKIREIRSSVHKYIDIKQLKRSIRNQTAKERLLFQVAAYMPLVIDAARFIKRVAKQSKR